MAWLDCLRPFDTLFFVCRHFVIEMSHALSYTCGKAQQEKINYIRSKHDVERIKKLLENPLKKLLIIIDFRLSTCDGVWEMKQLMIIWLLNFVWEKLWVISCCHKLRNLLNFFIQEKLSTIKHGPQLYNIFRAKIW